VKQNDLGEYEENAREKAKYIIYKSKAPTPPQISKSRRMKGFGENVGQLSLGVYVSHLNVPLLYMISQKMVSSQHV
jgi:hypothetical protein